MNIEQAARTLGTSVEAVQHLVGRQLLSVDSTGQISDFAVRQAGRNLACRTILTGFRRERQSYASQREPYRQRDFAAQQRRDADAARQAEIAAERREAILRALELNKRHEEQLIDNIATLQQQLSELESEFATASAAKEGGNHANVNQ